MYKDKTAVLFILTAFISGLCGSFFYPLSSLFIIEALGASPARLSLYLVLAICSSVIVSQFIAAQSDKGWGRKRILIVSLTSYFITVLSFTVIRNYYLALGVAVIFGSISGAIFGQLFALGREYADRHLPDSPAFISTMRAAIAIAWVFGPPIAFMLKSAFGFSASFLVSAIAISFTIFTTIHFLPAGLTQLNPEPDPAHRDTKPRLGTPIILFCITVVLMFAANNLYINTLPLYLSKELMVGANWIGLFFGMAALCEIPIMMNASRLANRWGTMRVLTVGLICGCLFYIGMLNVTQVWALLAIQIFNGVFIGLSATLGMVAMQDMMKDRLGTASTLFTNLLQISMLIASLSIGIVAELYNYYSAFYVCLTGAVCSLILLTYFVFKVESPNQAPMTQH